MTIIAKETFEFLDQLKANNNRDWFQEHKPDFENAKENFTDFIDDLIFRMGVFDDALRESELETKDCIFRIYRDARFAKDKSPYKTNLGAHIIAGGRKGEKDKAGYYVHLEPGNTFLAGGAFQPVAPWLARIREHINMNAGSLREILQDEKFRKYFGEISGETLKTAPRGYPKDHPDIDLLRYKSFLAVHNVDDKTAYSDTFIDHAMDVMETVKPFSSYLNWKDN